MHPTYVDYDSSDGFVRFYQGVAPRPYHHQRDDMLIGMFKDYYDILGLDEKAKASEIKQAFRRLAMDYHPDSNADPQAHQAFLDINEAYQTLSDSLKRGQYDLRRSSYLRGDWMAAQPLAQNPFTPAAQAYADRQAQAHRYQRAKAAQAQARAKEFADYRRRILILAGLGVLFALSLLADIGFSSIGPKESIEDLRLMLYNNKLVGEVITNRQSFTLDHEDFGRLGKGDRIAFRETPLYHIKSYLYIWRPIHLPGNKMGDLYADELPGAAASDAFAPHAGIYNIFSVFILLLLGASFTCYHYRHRSELQFKMGLLTLLMFLINILLLLMS